MLPKIELVRHKRDGPRNLLVFTGSSDCPGLNLLIGMPRHLLHVYEVDKHGAVLYG